MSMLLLNVLKDQGYTIVSKTITIGTGTTPTENLFAVTGLVEAVVFGLVDTTVTSGGSLTLSLGVTGTVAGLIAATAKAQLVADRIWSANSTTAGVAAKPDAKLIKAANITHSVAVADATAGKITYYCAFKPVSPSSYVAAA